MSGPVDQLRARAYKGKRLDRVEEALFEDGPRQKQQGWSFVKQVVSEDDDGFTMVALYERTDDAGDGASPAEHVLATGAKRSAPAELLLGLMAIGSWILLAVSMVLVVIEVFNQWDLIAAIISVVALPITALVGPFVIGFALGDWLPLVLMLAGWGLRFIPARVIAREKDEQEALRDLIAAAVLDPVLVDDQPATPDADASPRSAAEAQPAGGFTGQPTEGTGATRDRVHWTGLPWASGTIPSPPEVAQHTDSVLNWTVEGNAEQTPIVIGDRYWWDYGQDYRSFSPQERGLLSALSDGVALAAASEPALEELRWRLHSGVLLGEFRLVATVADRGATSNSALRDVFEFVATAYLGPDNGVVDGGRLAGSPEFNGVLSRQQTGAVVQSVWTALPSIGQRHSLRLTSEMS